MGDREVIDCLAIDISQLVSIVSQVGSQISSQLFRSAKRTEMSLVDITVLRFPNAENPFFQVIPAMSLVHFIQVSKLTQVFLIAI